MIDLSKLAASFPPDRISWRVGSTTSDKQKGMALAYIDARDVMGRLDEVCGIGGWQCRYLAIGATKTSCEIGVKIGDEWVWKADGAGDTDFEGDKGAFSDAFKRAAVKWGIGRYLYDVDAPWVQIEPMGKSFKIKEGEHARLRGLLSRGQPQSQVPAIAPASAKPAAAAKPTLGQWVAERKTEIDQLRSPKAFNTWWQTHDEKLRQLQDTHAAVYDGIVDYFNDAQMKIAAA